MEMSLEEQNQILELKQEILWSFMNLVTTKVIVEYIDKSCSCVFALFVVVSTNDKKLICYFATTIILNRFLL